MKTPAIPHFYRQRLLLALIREFEGDMNRTDLHKRLFLFMREEGRSEYEFFPYKYGCWSMNCDNDLQRLSRLGWLETGDNVRATKTDIPPDLIKESDWEKLKSFADGIRGWSYKDLIKHVYTEHPYYAINSNIAEEYLSGDELEVVKQNRPSAQGRALYTIGYEGISFERYVNRLIENDIKLLCDVRKNPLSRKTGFSRGTLQSLLPKVGIEYVHIPELGIEGGMRRNLETVDDYKKLFSGYTRTLPGREKWLFDISGLVKEHERVALTCFESDPRMCHRSCVSDYISTLEPKLNIEHI